jgi:hypothetical protein
MISSEAHETKSSDKSVTRMSRLAWGVLMEAMTEVQKYRLKFTSFAGLDQ